MTQLAQTLAQTSASPSISALAWVGLLLILVVIGVGALGLLRRRLLGDSGPPGGAPLTLHDLRQAHARGDMTDDEFEAARSAILGAAGASPRDPTSGELRAQPGYDLTGAPLPTRDSRPDTDKT